MAAVQHAVASLHPPTGTERHSGYVGPERRNPASREQLVRRVRREFEEMPGLRLTFSQATLLFDLSPGCCERILVGLMQAGFLVRTRLGLYGRRDIDI